MARGERKDPLSQAVAIAEAEIRLTDALLIVLTDQEKAMLRESIARGLQLFRVRARFDIATLDEQFDAFQQAAKPFGEVITYLPTDSHDDDGSLDLDLLMSFTQSKETLIALLSRFSALVYRLYLSEEQLAELERRDDFSDLAPDSINIFHDSENAVSTSPFYEQATHTIHFQSRLSTIEADLEQLKVALEPLAEIIDYSPVSTAKNPDGAIELQIEIVSSVSLDALRSALVHLGLEVQEVAQPLGINAAKLGDYPMDPIHFSDEPIHHRATKPKLLGIYLESPEHPLWSTIERGNSLYRAQFLFTLATFDQHLDEFKAAVKSIGETLAYIPMGVRGDVDSVEVDLWFTSAIANDALLTAFDHFALAEE